MKTNIKGLLGVIAVLAFSLGQAEAATYSPVLGNLLSGNTDPNPNLHKPFDLYNTDYVGLGVQGDFTSQAGTDRLQNGDTLELLLSFSNLRENLTGAAADSPLGQAGYAAIFFSGQLANSVNNPGNLGAADVVGAGVQAFIGGAVDADAVLLTSESYNFSAEYNTANIASKLGGDVEVAGYFNLNAPTNFTISNGLNVSFDNVTKFLANGVMSFDVDVANSPIEFWSVSPNPGITTPTRTGSHGDELFLNFSGAGASFETTSAVISNGTTQSLTGVGIAAMNPVPEPSSLLAIAGCFGVAGFASRRRKKRLSS